MTDVHWLALIVAILLGLIWFNKYCECSCDDKIIWFYQDGCRFCVEMKGEWDLFARNAPRYLKVQSVDIFDPVNAKMVQEYRVKGVPYIIKEKNGRRYVYAGPRKAADLLHWAIN